MTIDEIYINEAIRIRQEYVSNMEIINDNETMINNVVSSMEAIADEIEDVDSISDDVYTGKLKELDNILEQVKIEIIPYHEKILELGNDQQKLLLAIKDKYPKLSVEEIQQQIIPHIIKLDEKLKKRVKKESN